ncbi:MAG TPA: cadherin-like beta sandwich domain-containing protein [Clostridium sp.]
MNKNIKRTIAMALTIGAFSVVGQTNYSIFTTEAHASTSDASELTDLELTTSSGSNLDLYKDNDYDHELSDDLKVDGTYYTKTSSSNVVIEGIHGADEDNVRIFKENSNTAYKVDEDISISSKTTTILKVRVYKDEYDENKIYSSSDYNQYTIKLENTKDNDNINLSSLKLSSGYIHFNKYDTSYEFNVALNVDSIIVQALPEDDDYKVEIDGTTVNEDDNYEKTVSLSTDSTTIEVKVSDSKDNTKIYTLKVIKTDATQEKGDFNENNGLHNGWRDKNSSGNNGIHKGWRDENGAWRYLDTDGNMKKGWLKDTDKNWYYLDNDGKMKTGWYRDTDQNWYYLDNNGKMKINWIKDTDGNWYYLQSSGKMAKNTTIDGYKLDINGAWVK